MGPTFTGLSLIHMLSRNINNTTRIITIVVLVAVFVIPEMQGGGSYLI
jgi:hypothetical protein